MADPNVSSGKFSDGSVQRWTDSNNKLCKWQDSAGKGYIELDPAKKMITIMDSRGMSTGADNNITFEAFVKGDAQEYVRLTYGEVILGEVERTVRSYPLSM